jgi:hypothetical protein
MDPIQTAIAELQAEVRRQRDEIQFLRKPTSRSTTENKTETFPSRPREIQWPVI